ncbi:MAG: hypothetical protein WAK84_00805 [Candidatus Cybelea sp.]|jgi:hypothetical protein
MNSSTRFVTIVLAAGAAVLLLAMAVGERMGSRVIGQATEQTLQSVSPQAVTPAPDATPQPYGPDWKRSQALSAAGDPRFPDPRVPPQPLPTALPTATPKPAAAEAPGPPTPTPNPNIPIWRQRPLPTSTPFVQITPAHYPSSTPLEEGTAGASPSPP